MALANQPPDQVSRTTLKHDSKGLYTFAKYAKSLSDLGFLKDNAIFVLKPTITKPQFVPLMYQHTFRSQTTYFLVRGGYLKYLESSGKCF